MPNPEKEWIRKKVEQDREEILKAFDSKDLGKFAAKPEENDDDYPSAEMIKKVVRDAASKKKVRFAGDPESMDDDSSEEEDKFDSKDGRFDDPVLELKSLSQLKIASGVKTVRYDEFGIPLTDDIQKFISKGEMAPGAVFLSAPVMKGQESKKQYFKDYEKEPEKMTEEERAVFDCLQDEEGGYEELDDDFIFLANEGNVALVEDDEKNKEKPKDVEKKEHSDDEELEDDEDIFVEKKITKYAEKMDAKDPQFNEYFNQVMHEYAEEDIGEGEEDESVENIDLIDKDALDSILDEFLETEKNRKPVKEAIEKIQGIRRSENIAEVKAMDEATKEDIKNKIIELDNEVVAEEEETQSSDEEEAEEKKWDAETILTTYTNTENHPKVISEEPPKHRRHRKVKTNKSDEKTDEKPEVIKKNEEEEDSNDMKIETKEEKKERKKQVKEERREKRLQKKQLKEAFKSEHGKISKIQTGNSGDVKPGVSIRRIY